MPKVGIRETSLMQRAIIIEKLDGGLKQREIALQHGISQSVISKIKSKFVGIVVVKTLPWSGRIFHAKAC